MYVRTYVRTYVCMYVCMYVLVQTCNKNSSDSGSLRKIAHLTLKADHSYFITEFVLFPLDSKMVPKKSIFISPSWPTC